MDDIINTEQQQKYLEAQEESISRLTQCCLWGFAMVGALTILANNSHPMPFAFLVALFFWSITIALNVYHYLHKSDLFYNLYCNPKITNQNKLMLEKNGYIEEIRKRTIISLFSAAIGYLLFFLSFFQDGWVKVVEEQKTPVDYVAVFALVVACVFALRYIYKSMPVYILSMVSSFLFVMTVVTSMAVCNTLSKEAFKDEKWLWLIPAAFLICTISCLVKIICKVVCKK